MKKIININTKKLEDIGHAYNASIIKIEGMIYMFYRVEVDVGFFSDIYAVELDKNFQPVFSTVQKIKIPLPKKSLKRVSFEDPRVFFLNKKLFLVCSLRSGNWNYSVGCFELGKNFSVLNSHYFNIGGNLKNLKSMRDKDKFKIDFKKVSPSWEKNWQFFDRNGKMGFVYSIDPHIVAEQVHFNKGKLKIFKTLFPLSWKYGVLRGGTPPIKLNDEYFSFFHSAVRKGKTKKYFMGAYSFSSRPPFRIKKITLTPLLSGDKFNRLEGKAVVFPCGAYLEKGKWFISYGYNDETVKIFIINHSDLIKKMSDISLVRGVNEFIKKKSRGYVSRAKDYLENKSVVFDRNIGKVGIAIRQNSPYIYYTLKRIKHLREFFNFKPNSKILGYIGWVGRGNIGDEACLMGFRNLFKDYQVVPYKLRVKQDYIEKDYEVIEKLNLFDYVFLGGGTLIRGGDEFSRDLKEALMLNKKCFVFGTGARSFNYFRAQGKSKEYGKHIAEAMNLIRRTDRVFVRGKDTSNLLKSKGIDSSKIEIIGDIALSACSPSKFKDSKTIGINIGAHTIEYGNQKRINKEIAKFIHYLQKEGWIVEIIPMHKSDFDMSHKFVSKYGLNLNIWENYLDVQATINKIKSCRIVVGQRLHSYIIAGGCGIPCIPLVYSSKCREFIEQMHLQEFAIRTDRLKFLKLAKIFDNINKNSSLIRKSLIEQGNEYRRKQKMAADKIISIIAKQ